LAETNSTITLRPLGRAAAEPGPAASTSATTACLRGRLQPQVDEAGAGDLQRATQRLHRGLGLQRGDQGLASSRGFFFRLRAAAWPR
jgi:hypothetical protein